MELLGFIRSKAYGVSECWSLSETCAINWDAWAAVGTCAAVAVALFWPTVQRRFVRRKANALFALTYRTDLIDTTALLVRINQEFDLFPDGDGAWAVMNLIGSGGQERSRFIDLCDGFKVLAAKEVDVTRWPAVDLRLAAKVAIAIESLRDLERAVVFVTNADRFGEHFKPLSRVHVAMHTAAENVVGAVSELRRALRDYPETSRIK